jgi:hypothetical protein
MIIASTGEVCFGKGLCLVPHTPVQSILAAGMYTMNKKWSVETRELPIEGWKQHLLGVHKSDFGDFEVEAVTGPERRIEGVFLSHHHAFYNPGTPDDAERRVFHEGVIASDLRGQREFSWGHVFCRVDAKANKDWLVLVFNPFSDVPLHAREVYRQLFAYEIPSAD